MDTIKIEDDRNLLFTEEEWKKTVPIIVRQMHEYVTAFCTPIYKHFGEYGEAWGTGSYLQLGGKIYIVTNEHVARVRSPAQLLLHQLLGDENLHPVKGNHVEFGWPLDIGLLPVDPAAWSSVKNKSRAIDVEMVALSHIPVATELLMFAGFSAERSRFLFKTLVSERTSCTAREVAPIADERFKSRFHFALDYRPDLAKTALGNSGLPDPHGFSGSAIWNTGFVESKMKGEPWTPEVAKVTGLVWGWPSSEACIVATRSEYVRSFLLGVPGGLANAEIETQAVVSR